LEVDYKLSRTWKVTLAVYLASVAVALNQFKVPPVLPTLMEDLGTDMATGGWLMSIVAVAAIILAIPAAVILNHLGPRNAGLLAVGFSTLGTILGALAENVGFLLAARAIEGIGLGLMAVIAPAVIGMWAKPAELGLLIGFWATWVPAGNVIMFNLASPLELLLGWRGIWWFGAAIGLLAMAVYGRVVGAPETAKGTQVPTPSLNWQAGLLNRQAWLLAVVFAGFAFSFSGYNTWVPAFLIDTGGANQSLANFVASLMLLATIPANIAGGLILDRTRKPKLVLSAALAGLTLLFLLSFRLDTVFSVAILLVALGLVAGIIPTGIFAFAPGTAPQPEMAGLALGIANAGQNIGLLLGPPVIGAAVAGGAWTSGTYPLMGAAAVALVAILVSRFNVR